MHFGEYELFPSLIGLSPLPTGHPKTFQRQPVRSSTVCYHSFNLPMGRSHGFASTTANCGALFRLAFAADPGLKPLSSLATVTRRLIMQKARRHPHGAPTACRRMVSGSVSLPCSGFFSPFPHGTGPLSVSQEYLALPDGPGSFTQGSTCPALLRIPLWNARLACTGLSPPTVTLSRVFQFNERPMARSYNPGTASTAPVWAVPRSLAATGGITFVFFSSGYLDVSVPRVRLPCGIPCLQHGGLPHSDTCGSYRMCRSPQLFAAYRVLRRL
jgi:hypothetical protein